MKRRDASTAAAHASMKEAAFKAMFFLAFLLAVFAITGIRATSPISVTRAQRITRIAPISSEKLPHVASL